MAALIHLPTGTRKLLATRTLVGRGPSCLLRIDHERISREHAVLYWDGRWLLRDLRSRNGCRVGTTLVPQDRDVVLRPGDRLQFGDPEAGEWELVDASPPTVFASHLVSDLQIEAEGDLLVLPTSSGDEAVIYQDEAGNWVLDAGDTITPIADGGVVEGAPWCVFLPRGSGPTDGLGLLSLGEAVLRLRADQTLEHVVLHVELRGKTIDLCERKYWFVLWVLAKERLGEPHLPLHDQGWVNKDRLARLTDIPEANLDTNITRARKDLARCGIEGAGRIVEARPGQRRLGVPGERVVLEG